MPHPQTLTGMLLAATVLRQPVSRLRWALVAGGFVGTLIIVRPGGDLCSAGTPSCPWPW